MEDSGSQNEGGSYPSIVPGLCYRLLPLLAIFADKDEENLITAAKGMAGALARRHFSSLHRFTAGFTAEPRRDPENPAEVGCNFNYVVIYIEIIYS